MSFIAIVATCARLFSSAGKHPTGAWTLFLPITLLALLQLASAYVSTGVGMLSAVSIVLIAAYILVEIRQAVGAILKNN